MVQPLQFRNARALSYQYLTCPRRASGCCFSRPAGHNAPYPEGEPTSPSARAINHSPHSPTDDDSVPASRGYQSPPRPNSHPHPHRHHRGPRPLSQHIDKPLRRHEWVARDRIWTRTELDTERAEFFDTRVTGRTEVWQVLRAALGVLWEADVRSTNGGQSRDEDGTGGLATAQGILKAAEVTLPTGDLANGAYDQLGNYYALPEWVVSDPINVVGHGGIDRAVVVVDRKDDELEEEETSEELDEEEALRRREEKGKGVADIKNMVKVRARLSENLPDVVVSIGTEESVRSLARKVAEESGLLSTKRVRVAYMGKILKESSSLQSQGWKKGHMVNALVFDRPSIHDTHRRSASVSSTRSDMSAFTQNALQHPEIRGFTTSIMARSLSGLM
ncbi:hypothetical protein F4779DRAFT_617319 [Xylariaceae sp. FL0662B]|nr:hypothetical protein F4779DRAFT_617319 [Xylariaceae sp. FL0662B]